MLVACGEADQRLSLSAEGLYNPDQEYIISLLGGCLHGIRSQLSANPLHP